MQKIIFNKNTDKVTIVAPASGCKNFKQNLITGVKILEKIGFRSVYNQDICIGDKLNYFAAPRNQRINDLKNALLDPETKIIWAFRGGYGSAGIVDELINIKPIGDKILIGFSDITALHALFHKIFKLPSIHSSVLNSLTDLQQSMLEPILQVISGQTQTFSLIPVNKCAQKKTSIIGKIIGGNLRVLTSIVGSKIEYNFKGKIVFLEEIDEIVRRIDSDLTQIYRSKNSYFKEMKALIFGDFINCPLFDETLQYFIHEIWPKNIPIYQVESIGHGGKNYPITISAEAKIIDNILTIKSPFGLI